MYVTDGAELIQKLVGRSAAQTETLEKKRSAPPVGWQLATLDTKALVVPPPQEVEALPGGDGTLKFQSTAKPITKPRCENLIRGFFMLSVRSLRFLSNIATCPVLKMSSSSTAESTTTPLIMDVKENIVTVLQRMTAAYESADPNRRASNTPRLVAVSKTKPLELVIACYEAGQRHFGENYIQELVQKSNSEQIAEMCPDIKWHFIGTVQTKQIPKLSSIPKLYCVETVSSEKMASTLAKACERSNRSEPLSVMVQVNTSDEEQKGGLNQHEAVDLAEFIDKSCPALRFMGFMTIGSLEVSQSKELLNVDFERLSLTKDKYCARTGATLASIELSMGMSQDFEVAIAQGSTNVRVGSTIFGPRIKRASPIPSTANLTDVTS